MFYSDLMDTSASHPALMLQDEQDIGSHLPTFDNDLFKKKINANMMVIISGVNSPQDILPAHDPSFFVSDDESQEYASFAEATFDQMNTDDVTVTTYKDGKTEIRQGEEIIPVSSLLVDESFEYFKNDFSQLNVELFDKTKAADVKFVGEVEDVRETFANGRKYEPFDMRVIEINALETIANEYGVASEQYKEASLILRDLFEKFVIPNFQQLHSGSVSAFILTPAVKQQKLRRGVASTMLQANDVCYKSASDCNNGTSHCSGNGQCTSVGGECFSCQCKSSAFVGESCQYINSVADFQLLFWTAVLLIVITSSVVVCIYQSGDIVDGGIIMAQSLPKQD
ncbi:uncharacterized protein EV154DRAFT_535819 [Mucor mucedo]|uniref:uncharacterized protein n=1 Tax=Mucor mucedo TaxID=29922 RepID=UPI00221EFE2C|nr:uncharacterized protein EV154DRAFT_535819 [Mucor mucedo]KAI7895999.1 hypothetical protein EV154DRAFT_535819 [Mucor mucedo]